MRARVRPTSTRVAGDKRPQLQAYADGVNAGLAACKVRPWPYLLLRPSREPWQLGGLARWSVTRCISTCRTRATRANWRCGRSSRTCRRRCSRCSRTTARSWDAPLRARPRRRDAARADQLDLRKLPVPTRPRSRLARSAARARQQQLRRVRRIDRRWPRHRRQRHAPEACARPTSGSARNCAIPIRARPGGKVDVGGFTLPGLPRWWSAATRHVAWGFTNSYGDWLDWRCALPADARYRHDERVRRRCTRIASASTSPAARRSLRRATRRRGARCCIAAGRQRAGTALDRASARRGRPRPGRSRRGARIAGRGAAPSPTAARSRARTS